MHQSMNAAEMIQGVRDNVNRRQDVVTAPENMNINPDTGLFEVETSRQSLRAEMTPHMQGQVAEWTGIGRRFWNKMNDYSEPEANHILSDTFRFLADKKPGASRLVRTIADSNPSSVSQGSLMPGRNGDATNQEIMTSTNTGRAFLSSRFLMFDNDELLDIAGPVMEESGADFITSDVTLDNLTLKLLYPKQEISVNSAVGDVVQMGLSIRNSEVGMGKISIQPLLYTLRCTNGMTGLESVGKKLGFSRVHLGTAMQDGIVTYQDDTLDALRQSTRLAFRDAVNMLGQRSTLEAIRDLLVAARESRQSTDPIKTVGLYGEQYNLTEDEQKLVIENFIRDQSVNGYTKYGLANAVTATANSEALSFDRATELETMGGRIIEMNDSAWTSLAEVKQS